MRSLPFRVQPSFLSKLFLRLFEQIIFFEYGWIFARELFKCFIEIGNVLKAAFVACFGHRFVLHKNFFRLVNAKVIQKISERVVG